VARPMPPVEPVTTQTRPVSPRSTAGSVLRVETTILLARHGETDWNRDRRWQGHSDMPLNESGRDQARALADELAGETIDAVYSSDLVRAHETARIVAERSGLDVTVVPDLREVNVGSWEGLSDDEVRRRFPDAARGGWENGETYEQMGSRVIDALRRIADTHAGQRVLVVAHGGPLRAALRHCSADHDDSIPNCHVVRLVSREGSGLEIRSGPA
jgi:broad specificity phosphatase PhoE